jgi:putative PIN family toxin of toxin-antitoxin system
VKVVFDTNVFFAALITPGVCAKLLLRARRGDFHLVMCPGIRDELAKVLRAKLKSTPGEVRQDQRLVEEAIAEECQPPGTVRGVCRDPDDDHVLDCLQASGADYLVTGDDDLQTLKEFHGARILSPREFEMLFKD